MKVFVTGATGFVGAHTALALLEAGHEVRFLVRNAETVKQYFAEHGHQVDDLVVADMRDKATIARSMDGCDAVFHAAAAVCLDPGKAEATYRNNVDGMNAVIGSACELGITRIVYVSSLAVLFHPGAPVIDEQMPLADSQDAYSRSKRDSDAHVREMQKRGMPVHMTYPAAIFGPHDPKLSEANRALISFLTKMFPRTSSGMQCVDVRDLAQAHVYLLEHPPEGDFENARYILGGHFHAWGSFHAMLEKLTGTRISSVRIPGPVFRFMGTTMDLIRKVIPFNTDVTSESMAYITQWPPADSSRIQGKAGLSFRSGEETFADTIAWMAEAGHLDARHAGRLA